MHAHPFRFAVLAVALLAIGTSLQAQGRGPGFGPGHGRGEGRGFMGLNLTEAQQAQVKAIHERHQAAFKAKGEAAQAARKAMRAAMADAGADAKTLQGLHDKVSTAQFDLMLEHRAVRQEILPLLTPEQKAQFEKRPMGLGPRGGRGRGPGAGRGMNPDCPMVKPS